LDAEGSGVGWGFLGDCFDGGEEERVEVGEGFVGCAECIDYVDYLFFVELEGTGHNESEG